MTRIVMRCLILTTVLTSCTSKNFDSAEELLEYIKQPENGYLYTKSVNGVDFSMLYKPTDLLVDQELTGAYSSSKVDSLRSKYRAYLYFTLSMSKNNQELLSNVAGNKQQFGAMVNELAFGMEQKVHLYTPQKDTIAMADYIYPRMYGMSGATTMLLVYPRDKKVTNEDYFIVTIEDLGFYTGEVKFKIPTEMINNEPRIKFK
ncbi:hypothetical protein J9332_11800 [Aquimarina celericrescens]|nr:hypothetical protein [Aquimarina celericrescens]